MSGRDMVGRRRVPSVIPSQKPGRISMLYPPIDVVVGTLQTGIHAAISELYSV